MEGGGRENWASCGLSVAARVRVGGVSGASSCTAHKAREAESERPDDDDDDLLVVEIRPSSLSRCPLSSCA